MLSKKNIIKIFTISFVMFYVCHVQAQNLIAQPLSEGDKNQDAKMWDDANEMFGNIPPPPVLPDVNNSVITNDTDQNKRVVNNSFILNNTTKKITSMPLNSNNVVSKSEKKIPIGKTNQYQNSNFKNKSIPEYAKFNLVGLNKNLPPVYFESNLVGDAFKAVRKKDISILQYLIKQYDLENFVNEQGDNLLLRAAKDGSVNSLRVMLANKYDINFINNRKMSALHIAVINQDISMVKTLLTMGINTQIKDSENMTALDYAKEVNPEINRIILNYIE